MDHAKEHHEIQQAVQAKTWYIELHFRQKNKATPRLHTHHQKNCWGTAHNMYYVLTTYQGDILALTLQQC